MTAISICALPTLEIVSRMELSRGLHAAIDAITSEQLESLPLPSSRQPHSQQVLFDSPELLVVATRWLAGAKSELTSHTEGKGLLRIIRGTVEEERYLPQSNKLECEIELLTEGQESLLHEGSFRQVRALEESITLHIYTPRTAGMNSSISRDDLPRIADARRDYQPKVAHQQIKFPNWGVKSSGHVKTIEKLAVELAPGWAKHEAKAHDDADYRVPHRILEEIRSSGILAAPIPRFWGGLTASLTETARAITHIAEHAPAAALALVGPLGNAATCRIPLSAVPREHAETLRAHQRWIAEKATRGRILAVANSESANIGQSAQTRTVASREIDGDFYLTGQKVFATLGPDADYFLCSARTAVDVETPIGTETTIRVEGYFVHREAPGVTLNDYSDLAGLRPSASVGLNLEYAPAEQLFGYPGCLETVNAGHWSTLLYSAVFLGIGNAVLREAIRNNGNSPWARAKLADQALALDAAAGYLETVCEAEIWPMPKELLNRVERVKAFVTQTVVQVATQAAMLSGGACYSINNSIYRLLNDSLAGPSLRPSVSSAVDSLLETLGK